MKKLIIRSILILVTVLGFSACAIAQSSACGYSACVPSIPFDNTDNLQIYGAIISKGIPGSSFTQKQGVTASITNQDTTIVIGNTASFYLKLTSITITNASASVGTWVNLYSGISVVWTGYIVSQGGAVVTFDPGSPLTLGLNRALRIRCETTGADVRCSAVGFLTQ